MYLAQAMNANETNGENAWWQLPENAVSCIEQVLETTPQKTLAVRPPTTYRENYPS